MLIVPGVILVLLLLGGIAKACIDKMPDRRAADRAESILVFVGVAVVAALIAWAALSRNPGTHQGEAGIDYWNRP